MKKATLLLLFCMYFFHAQSQVITDTVSIGASYNSQVWYNMFGGEEWSAAFDNWDLAFDLSPMGYAIAINSANDVRVWKYRKEDTTGWNTIDTVGMNTWQPHWNSENYWELGAIGNYTNPNVLGDVDWGKYNPITHNITGDSLYIIRLSDGKFKKLWIVSLIGTMYTFRYANLDGSNTHTINLNKYNYLGKNLAYFNIGSNAIMDREPYSEDWDIIFTAYTALGPAPRTEAAVLSNSTTLVAKYSNIDAGTFKDYANAVYFDSINTIGHNWKTGSGSSYAVQDSLLYFVQTQHGDIWKLVFKSFDGTAGGNYIFTKEPLNTTVSVNYDAEHRHSGTMTLYPNPSNGGACSVVYSIDRDASKAVISVHDMSGRIVHQNQVDTSKGLHQYALPLHNLSAGVYLVTLVTNGSNTMQQKLVIQ